MSASLTEADFTDEKLRENPRVYWNNVQTVILNQLSSLFQQQTNQFLQGVMNVLSVQLAELTLFRELETRIKHGTLTDDEAQNLFAGLDALREHVATKAREVAGNTDVLRLVKN